MLDNETKRRIDTARDILVGKVPDPKSQVEQITIALIYKFMDDMDSEAVELGGERAFFNGDWARYAWTRLMRSGLSGADTLALYSDAIARMPENAGIPPLFRSIFNNAYLPYRDPETLKSFLKIIDEFNYDHSEKLGDAFEYLLSVLGSQGDAGQFRTPRHIIDFIVEVVDPEKGESILDPACGTAGFLISAYKHILKSNRDAQGLDALTPDEKGHLARNLVGYDISPDMVRLSLVNLYLHGFANPRVDEYDTLTSEEKWSDQADVILANPPFMSPKGGIKPHNRFSVESRRSEALFLSYVLTHLTPMGKAGVIVPEGIHFVAQRAYTRLRKSLINENFLIADITLPHGVFKPYASVKTHVLVINRALARKSQNILFIEVKNDGFSQSDTREAIQGSQLQAALRHINSFKEAITNEQDWARPDDEVHSFALAKTELSSADNSHLLGRWHDLPNRVIHRSEIPLMRIGDICTICEGLSPNMATQPGDFTMVVPAKERKSADHWSFEGKAVCIPLVSSSGHGKADIKRLHYQEGQFALANTMCALFVIDENIILPKYLFMFLSSMSEEILVPLMCGATNVTMNSNKLLDVIIPVPDIKLQEEVVESELLNSQTQLLLNTANTLCESSSAEAINLAKIISTETEAFLKNMKKRITISEFLPS